MIHFVGAGSGAADLITVRGARLLQAADVIIYAGSLVNPALLDYAGQDCRIYNSAEMTLEQVIAVMRDAEASNKMTVRLHTGDSSIYGAVREQFDALEALGIDYDVCPGVSAFCGAAAALKAEYTLPEVSQTVIISRAGGRTPVPDRESIADLAKTSCDDGAVFEHCLGGQRSKGFDCGRLCGGYACGCGLQGDMAGGTHIPLHGRHPCGNCSDPRTHQDFFDRRGRLPGKRL